jgi:excisionase family DNA binding protein
MSTATTPQRLLYTPDNAGAILDVGRTTIYQLIASGELRSVKIGRSRRIPADALEDYVNKLTAGAAA